MGFLDGVRERAGRLHLKDHDDDSDNLNPHGSPVYRHQARGDINAASSPPVSNQMFAKETFIYQETSEPLKITRAPVSAPASGSTKRRSPFHIDATLIS